MKKEIDYRNATHSDIIHQSIINILMQKNILKKFPDILKYIPQIRAELKKIKGQLCPQNGHIKKRVKKRESTTDK